MKRILFFLYGVTCYALFFGTFLYSIGFLGNLLVPRSIDSETPGPLGAAIAIDLALALVFAVQHSVMARPSFKRWWTRFVPEPLERSTYVLLSSLAMILLFWQWRPLGGVIWDIEHSVARGVVYGAYAFGWLLVLVSTFLINHFDLFGLRQVYLHLRGKPYTPVKFVTPGPYKLVRHPLYVGWLFVFWSAPMMSAGHLLLTAAITGYILVAIKLEERNLEDDLGRPYAEYRRSVPMLIPALGSRQRRGEQSENVTTVA